MSKEEVVQSLRKQSRGAQKTSSQYRGVTKHQKGKWEARIGQMVGRKYKSALSPCAPITSYLFIYITLIGAQQYGPDEVAG